MITFCACLNVVLIERFKSFFALQTRFVDFTKNQSSRMIQNACAFDDNFLCDAYRYKVRLNVVLIKISCSKSFFSKNQIALRKNFQFFGLPTFRLFLQLLQCVFRRGAIVPCNVQKIFFSKFGESPSCCFSVQDRKINNSKMNTKNFFKAGQYIAGCSSRCRLVLSEKWAARAQCASSATQRHRAAPQQRSAPTVQWCHNDRTIH
jgi:hypothetical protein